MGNLLTSKDLISIECECGNVHKLTEKDKKLILETVYSKEQREAMKNDEPEIIEEPEQDKDFNPFNL